MWSDTRAELLVQIRRPANWLLLAVAVALTVTFAYVVPYAAGERTDELATARFAGTAIGGLPAFTGCLALIFGVLVAGSDYGWGTWKTMLVQQPSRLRVYSGKLVVVAAGTLLLVLTLLAASAAASRAVAGLDATPVAWPPLPDLVRGLAAGWLIAATWGLLGAVLAIAMRGVALPVGIGLVWMLAVQNLVSGLAAPLLDWVDDLQPWLPGGAAGALAAASGARAGTLGVTDVAGAVQSGLVLGGYVVAFALVAGALFRRRDIT